MFDIGHLSKEQKSEIVREFTAVASRVTGIPESGFYVFIREYDPESIGVGGTLIADRN